MVLCCSSSRRYFAIPHSASAPVFLLLCKLSAALSRRQRTGRSSMRWCAASERTRAALSFRSKVLQSCGLLRTATVRLVHLRSSVFTRCDGSTSSAPCFCSLSLTRLFSHKHHSGEPGAGGAARRAVGDGAGHAHSPDCARAAGGGLPLDCQSRRERLGIFSGCVVHSVWFATSVWAAQVTRKFAFASRL